MKKMSGTFTATSPTFFRTLPETPMTKLSVEWVQGVLRCESLTGWTCRVVAHDGYCWLERKEIEVCEAECNLPGLWLHEIAHAVRGPALRLDGTMGDQHDGRFADIFQWLVNTYTGAQFKAIWKKEGVIDQCAVNCHETLLAACRLMKERLTGLAYLTDACWADWPGACVVDAALALAGK